MKTKQIKIKSRSEDTQPTQLKRCPVCGSPALIPNGSCYVCSNCGTTTGCS